MKMFPNGSISGLWAQENLFSLNWSISTQAQWLVCGCPPHPVEKQICCDWNIGYCTAGSASLCSSTVEWFICNIYEVLLVQSLLAFACAYSQFSGAKRLPILCFLFGPLKLHCFLLPRYFLEKVGGRKQNCQLANLRIFWLEQCLWICNEKLMRGCGFLCSCLSRMTPCPLV